MSKMGTVSLGLILPALLALAGCGKSGGNAGASASPQGGGGGGG